MSNKTQGSAGRFGVRYGTLVRNRISAIESKQRKKQICIFCNGRAKRISKGIWLCKKCGKKFAGHAYFLEKNESIQEQEANVPLIVEKSMKKEKAKILKRENPVNNEEKPKKVRKSKTKSEEKKE